MSSLNLKQNILNKGTSRFQRGFHTDVINDDDRMSGEEKEEQRKLSFLLLLPFALFSLISPFLPLSFSLSLFFSFFLLFCPLNVGTTGQPLRCGLLEIYGKR